MFDVHLKDGTVSCSSARFEDTYGGVLEGGLTRRVHESLCQSLLREAAKLGAHVPVKAFLPLPEDRVRLPRISCIADLTSPSPTGKKEADGSHLRIVWMQDSHEGLPFPPKHVLDAVDWDRDAKDFDW